MTTRLETAQYLSPTRLLERLAPLAAPLTRISVGLILMPHGAQKLFGWFGGGGLVATGQFFETLGFQPGLVWAALAGLIEFFGGLALVLGYFTRPIALIVAGFLAVAMTVHLPQGFFWSSGGIEYPLLWSLVAFAIFLRGVDPYSVDARRARAR